MTSAETNQLEQILFIIRHGERLDNVDRTWVSRAARPYDPPLTKVGEKQAEDVAKEFLDKGIQTIVCSPFLRCLQTGKQICKVLQHPGMHTCNGIVDVLNSHYGIFESPMVPTDDITSHNIPLLSMDTDPIPRFPESVKDGLQRFDREFKKIADKYYPNNILIITHGFGVSQGLGMSQGTIYRLESVWPEYCGYVELSRADKTDHKWHLKNFSKDVHVTPGVFQLEQK